LAQAIFELNIFLYKYHNNFNTIILPAYTTYEDGTRHRHITFRRWGITQKKEYNIMRVLYKNKDKI
jgi:hypothetical protein